MLFPQGERLVGPPPPPPGQAASQGEWRCGGPPGTGDGRGLGRDWGPFFRGPQQTSEGAAAAGMIPCRRGQEEGGVGWLAGMPREDESSQRRRERDFSSPRCLAPAALPPAPSPPSIPPLPPPTVRSLTMLFVASPIDDLLKGRPPMLACQPPGGAADGVARRCLSVPIWEPVLRPLHRGTTSHT